MDYMTVQDIRKIANEARQVGATMDEPTKCYYAWMNDSLMKRFNRGRDQFKARLAQLISGAPVVRCPWDHVGKNH